MYRGALLFLALWLSGTDTAFAVDRTGTIYPHCPPSPEQVVLSSCERYPTFDPADILRQNHGEGAYDLIYYDLNYLVNQQVLLTFSGPWGPPTTQTVTKQLPETRHFEVSEQYGNESTVAAQVQAYLKSRQIYFCQ